MSRLLETRPLTPEEIRQAERRALSEVVVDQRSARAQALAQGLDGHLAGRGRRSSSASAAAAPAASPVAKQGGISLVALWLRWSTEIHRPVTSRFSTSRASRHPNGIAYTAPYLVQCPVIAIAPASGFWRSSCDEHVAADQPAALGDADQARDLAQVRVAQLGVALAQRAELLHHEPAAGDLGEGEVARIGRVDLALELGDAAPGQERLAGVRRAEERRAGGDRGVDVA